MNFEHYTDRSVALAVDLVNDFAPRKERPALAGREALAELLSRHGIQAAGLTNADAEAAPDLATRLLEVFEAPDDADAVNRVNRILADATTLPQISGHDDHDWHLHFEPPRGRLIDRVASTAAMGLAMVICDYGTRRLGVCADDDCRDVYVDSSRNCSRRYCCEGCSNRANVAAFRARAREAE